MPYHNLHLADVMDGAAMMLRSAAEALRTANRETCEAQDALYELRERTLGRPALWDAPDGCTHSEPAMARAPELAPDLIPAPAPAREPTPAPDAPPPPIDPPALAPAPRGRGKVKAQPQGQPQPEPTPAPAPAPRRDPSELLARMAPAAPAVPPAEAPPEPDLGDEPADDVPPL